MRWAIALEKTSVVIDRQLVHSRPCVTHDIRGAVSDRHAGATTGPVLETAVCTYDRSTHSAGSGATMLMCTGVVVQVCSRVTGCHGKLLVGHKLAPTQLRTCLQMALIPLKTAT